MVESFVYIALVSMIIFALSSVTSKFLIVQSGGAIQFTLLQLNFGIIPYGLLLIYFVLVGTDFSSLWSGINPFLLLGASFFSFLGFLTLIVGFGKGNASVGGVVLSARVFVSIPVAFLILRERYELIVYFLIFLALVGAVISSWREGMNFVELITFQAKGMRWFVLTAVFWSFGNSFVRYISDSIPLFLFLISRQILMVIYIHIAFQILKRKYRLSNPSLSKQLARKMIIYVLILLIAQAGLVFSLRKSLTITEGIGVLEGVFTLMFSMLYARFVSNDILDEPLDRKSVLYKIIGTAIALFGTYGAITNISQIN